MSYNFIEYKEIINIKQYEKYSLNIDNIEKRNLESESDNF